MSDHRFHIGFLPMWHTDNDISVFWELLPLQSLVKCQPADYT